MRSSAFIALLATAVVSSMSCSRCDQGKDAPDSSGKPGVAPASPPDLAPAARALDLLRRRFVLVDDDGLRFATIPIGEAKGFTETASGIVPSFDARTIASIVPAHVTLPAFADAAFRLAVGDVAIDVRLDGASPAKAQLAGDALLYEGAILGGTLVHVPRRVGTEEFVAVPEKPADSTLRYDVTLHGVAGLRLTYGVLELLDATGNPVLRTQAPTVYDAHGVARKGTLAVEGCAVDTADALPWGRPTTTIGSDHCTVVTRWSDEGLTYPILVDPAWTTTAVLAQKRAKHRAAAITGTSGVAACTSGCVLVTGGIDALTTLSSCELFNVATKTWGTAAALPVQGSSAARAEHVAIDTGEGRVVVAGGHTLSGAGTVTAATAIYSAATNAWTALGDLPSARARLGGAMTFNGTTREIVVTGGNLNLGTNATNAVDRLSFPGLTWTTGGLLKAITARYNHAMAGFVKGGVSYYIVAGGLPGPTTSVEFETSAGLSTAGSWSSPSPGLSAARSGVAVAVVGDGILFGGGFGSGSTYYPNVDKFLFSTTAMSFPFAGALSTARGFGTGVTVGTTTLRGLFAAGETGSSPTFTGSSRSDLVASDGTVLSGDMAYARDYAQASPLPNGGALISGGYGSFDPSTSTVNYPLAEELFLALSNGTACGSAFDCDSKNCVDGVCCDTSCTGQCQACNLTATKGTCTTVTSGNAISPRAACDKFGTVCGASCDGTFFDKCHYSPSSTSCGAATCTSGTETHATTCDGSGGCNTATTTACTPYKCNLGATACLTNCTSISDCATGYKCDASNHCVTTGGAGAACSTTPECTSGLTCVDGVCCTASSCPAGQKCNIAPAAGTCKLPYGATCSAASATSCATGNCVDGVCCDSACTGQCEACDSPVAGACSPVVGPPHGTRGACGGSGACQAQCNGSNRLACGTFPGSGTTCSAAACTSGSAVPSSTCNGLGGCTAVTPTACLPYTCGATACKTSCAGPGDCGSGYFCSGTTCASTGAAGTTCTGDSQCASNHCVDGACCTVASCTSPLRCDAKGDGTCSKPLGATCSADGECGKGHCVDGLCCNSACPGQCEACNVSGSEGTCTQVLSGPPHGTRAACAGTGTCQAKCDGSSRTACGAAPGTSTICAAASCTGAALTPTAFCDGTGSCALASTISCGAYRCGGSACKATCTTATSTLDCNDGYVCKLGACVTTGGAGTVCSDDTECASGHCVDGGGSLRVCCEAASCPSGSVCAAAGSKAPAGQCIKTDGQTCGAPGECSSGFCVDGHCCDTACDGQCEACDISGNPGKCSGVSGPVHGTTRTACSSGGGDICKALQCDGTKDRLKCASFASGLDVECGPATCTAGKATAASTCDGAGACKPGATVACGAYACGAKACNSSCTRDSDCSSGFACEVATKTCVPQTSKCSDDRTSSIPADSTSAPKPCGAYLCDNSTGNCFPQCSSSDQCAPGYSCSDAHECVSQGTGDSGGSGGCATSGTTSSGASPFAAFGALVALVGLVGRKRRRHAAVTRGSTPPYR